MDRATPSVPNGSRPHGRRRGAGLRAEHRAGLTALVACVVMVTFPVGGHAPRGRIPQEGGRVGLCTFTNPAYAGECVESTTIPEGSTAEKACRVVLECLNNPRCPQSYCRATTVRSGWVLKQATEE